MSAASIGKTGKSYFKTLKSIAVFNIKYTFQFFDLRTFIVLDHSSYLVPVFVFLIEIYVSKVLQ
jgi:hypothetical protein